MDKFAALWSGGKDSCFAYWKAISQGIKISHLLNFINKDLGISMSHGLDRKLMTLQAQALELPIVQRGVTWETYEAEFKLAIEELKLQGITGVVSGDVDLQEHKDWIDRVCGEVGVKAILPLWKIGLPKLLTDFIDAGFKAIIVSVKAEFFDKEWLGKQVDRKFVAELCRLNIDPWGESGEYHTFVIDGPPFKKSIKIATATPVLKDNRWFLDISISD